MKYVLNKIIEEAKKNGIEYNDNSINDSTCAKSIDSQTYVDNLNSEAMLSEEVFDKFQNEMNINWEHIKKVITLSETKYKNVTIENNFKKSIEKYLKDE